MRISRILISVSLLVFAATSSGAAERLREPAPSPLYALEKASLPKSNRPLLPNAAEEFLIQVDPADVAANPPSFLIDLPDHALLEAVRTSFVNHGTDWKSWFGTLRYASGGDPAGSIHIGYHGAQISALIQLDDGGTYRIAGGFGERHRLVRLDVEKAPQSCGLESPDEADHAGEETPHLSAKQAGSLAPPATTKVVSCAARPTIDLLVVYPAKGSGGFTGYFGLSEFDECNLRTFVQNSIDRANQVFANNKIGNSEPPYASYHLVGVVPLIGQDNLSDPQLPTNLGIVLEWMNEEHTELRNLRNAFGADVVAVYIPSAWNTNARCGFGNLRLLNESIRTDILTTTTPFNKRAFSAYRDGCGLDDFTLAHEIGHNFGMRHHDDTDFPTFRYDWARGYQFTDSTGVVRGTVMGNCFFEQPCHRIAAFSDPDRRYNATTGAIGTDVTGVFIGTGFQHNARVACDDVTAYSDFRCQSPNTPPKASFTVSCTGRTCTFNAGASTDNAVIPANNYWWDFGDGSPIVRSGSVYTYTYGSSYPMGSTLRAHLVVKDNGLPLPSSSCPEQQTSQGQTGVAWRNVTLQAPDRDAECIPVNVPTTMTAGQVYPVSVTVKNTGTLTWSPIGPQCNAYRLGTANSNTWGVPGGGRVELPHAVAPGEQEQLTFNVTAPTTPGIYNFQWRMVQECVTWFGHTCPNVPVNVQAPPPIIYQGYHDIGNCRDIYGWARDANSSSAINVSIYRDGSYDASVLANIYRADLYNAGIGTGRYGFDYVPNSPAWRDGLWHSATVRFPSGVNLNTTPKSIICNLPMFPNPNPGENNPTGGQVYSVATQFSSNYNGYIWELGFYRAPGETGSNTLHLTTDDGELASVTPYCGSSGMCWGTINPVYITAGTRYRVWVNTNTYQVKTGCGIGGGFTTQQVLNVISGFWVAGNTFPTNGSCSNFFVDVKFDL